MGEFLLAAIVFGPFTASLYESNGYNIKESLISLILSIAAGFTVAWATSLVVKLYLPIVTGAVAYILFFYITDPYFSAFIKKNTGK